MTFISIFTYIVKKLQANVKIIYIVQCRDANFLKENQETGNQGPENGKPGNTRIKNLVFFSQKQA